MNNEELKKLKNEYFLLKEKFNEKKCTNEMFIDSINELADYYIRNFDLMKAYRLLDKCFEIFPLHSTSFYHSGFQTFFVNYYLILMYQIDKKSYVSYDKKVNHNEYKASLKKLISLKEEYKDNERRYIDYLVGREGNYTYRVGNNISRKRQLCELYEEKYKNYDGESEIERDKHKIFLEFFCDNKIPTYSEEQYMQEMSDLYN